MIKRNCRKTIAIVLSVMMMVPVFMPMTVYAGGEEVTANYSQKRLARKSPRSISEMVESLEPAEVPKQDTPPKSIPERVEELEPPVALTTPQDVYSVSTSIKSFKLNAKGNGALTYSSSNESVASVSSSGVVSVKRNGTAYITIEDGIYSKKVSVIVSSYKPTNGAFVEAIYNADGRSGDSTGREIRVKGYNGYSRYNSSKNWGFIIRCNDPVVADKAALAVNYIANNNHFGYSTCYPVSQSSVNNRASIYNTVVKTTGKNPSAASLKKILSISSRADTSCTPTCLSGYWLYYDMSDKLAMKWIPPYDKKAYNYYCGAVNVEYHQLETAIKHVNSIYRDKGMLEPFSIIYISANNRSSFFSTSNIKKNLKRGDIICSCPDYRKGGHTGIMM